MQWYTPIVPGRTILDRGAAIGGNFCSPLPKGQQFFLFRKAPAAENPELRGPLIFCLRSVPTAPVFAVETASVVMVGKAHELARVLERSGPSCRLRQIPEESPDSQAPNLCAASTLSGETPQHGVRPSHLPFTRRKDPGGGAREKASLGSGASGPGDDRDPAMVELRQRGPRPYAVPPNSCAEEGGLYDGPERA